MAQYDVHESKMRDYYTQEVLKTVTLGLSPYFPFSQQYSMEVKAQQGGTIKDGFFNIAPQSQTGGDPLWEDIGADYFGRYPRKDMEDKARGVPYDKYLNPLAKRITTMLDGIGKYNPAAREIEGSVVGEMREILGIRELEKFMKANSIHVPQSSLSGTAKETLESTTQGLSPETFDFVRGKETEAVFMALENVFKGVDLSNTVALEVTDSQFKKEIAQGITKNKSVDEAIEILKENVNYQGKSGGRFKTIARINHAFKAMYENLDKDVRKSSSDREILELLHIEAKKKGTKIHMNDPLFGHSLSGENTKKFNDMLKQFADRFFRMDLANVPAQLNNDYAYELPLGNTGAMALVVFGLSTKQGYPQVIAKSVSHAMFTVKDRVVTLYDALQRYSATLTGMTAVGMTTTVESLHQAAVNEWVNNQAKQNTTDWVLAATVNGAIADTAMDVSVDMWKVYGGKGEPSAAMKFSTTDIAKNLKLQFDELKKGKAGGVLGKEFEKIFALSNKASKVWKDIATSGQEDYEYLSNRGPNEPQGIWPEGNVWGPGPNPMGMNTAMVPLIASQAGAGVARFSYKTLGKRFVEAPDFRGDQKRVKFLMEKEKDTARTRAGEKFVRRGWVLQGTRAGGKSVAQQTKFL